MSTPSSPRQQWMLLACFLGLAGFAVWSYLQFDSSRAAAELGGQNLQVCQGLGEQIARLRQGSNRATFEARSSSELHQRIEQARIAASLPAESLVRIDPEAARRVGDTAYKEQLTHIDLQNASLEQLVRFLHSLASGDRGLEVRQVRLSAPRREQEANSAQEQEFWLAEVTLTCFIFSPKTPPSTSVRK